MILGYDGPEIHVFDTPVGKLTGRRLFVAQSLGMHSEFFREIDEKK